jgi:hypothetical protein
MVGNVILDIGTGTATSSDLSIIMRRSDVVAVPVHIFNITFPPLL